MSSTKGSFDVNIEGKLGRRLEDPAVDRAVDYLRGTQEPDGSWFGRWGVNYIYGTWQVLVGLVAAGVSPTDPAVRRGAAWLVAGAAHVLEEVGGIGADLVVEAVGTEATLAQAIELAGTGGEIIVFGTITSGEAGLPYYQLYHKELTIHNPRAARVGDYAQARECFAAAGSTAMVEQMDDALAGKGEFDPINARAEALLQGLDAINMAMARR